MSQDHRTIISCLLLYSHREENLQQELMLEILMKPELYDEEQPPFSGFQFYPS